MSDRRLLLLYGARLIGFVLLCLTSMFAQSQERSGKRLALVIGNDGYQHVSKLQKAGNDATAMARELRAAGFEVLLHRDLNFRGMVKAVETFANSITGGDQVVVFFAGHGVQIKAASYLLPVDIEANSESEVEKTAYGLLDLTEKLSEAKAAFALVIVDACRDNPLRTKSRAIGGARGLSAIEPPKGQMVVYSAGRGQQALERMSASDTNPNSVFTREFIARMKRPGVRIEDLVREVQDAVEKLALTVSHEQRPALYNEARGNFYFFGPTAAQMARQQGVASPAMTASQREDTFWDDAKAAGNKEAFEAYVGSYPIGRYASLARANIARLTSTSLALASVPLASAPATAPAAATLSTTSQASNWIAGTVFKDCDDCPEMLVIPAGRFVMGSVPNEVEREKLPVYFGKYSEPQHEVRVVSFSVGKQEVSRGQYRAFAQATGRIGEGCYVFIGAKFEYDLSKDWRNAGYAQDDQHPATCVSWSDARAYVVWLSQKTGKSYRLLTESEWEYAARAGTTTTRFWGDDANTSCAYANSTDLAAKRHIPGSGDWLGVANCDDRYAYTAPVGSYQANGFGLYDMLGNVHEWTEDCWNTSYSGAPVDGGAWTAGDCSIRVMRGGAWISSPQLLRTAFRDGSPVERRYNHLGFRVAREN